MTELVSVFLTCAKHSTQTQFEAETRSGSMRLNNSRFSQQIKPHRVMRDHTVHLLVRESLRAKSFIGPISVICRISIEEDSVAHSDRYSRSR
jgi:hypothetical protein